MPGTHEARKTVSFYFSWPLCLGEEGRGGEGECFLPTCCICHILVGRPVSSLFSLGVNVLKVLEVVKC